MSPRHRGEKQDAEGVRNVPEGRILDSDPGSLARVCAGNPLRFTPCRRGALLPARLGSLGGFTTRALTLKGRAWRFSEKLNSSPECALTEGAHCV